MNKIISAIIGFSLLAFCGSVKCEWSGEMFSRKDVDLICKTVCCEANTQDFETKYMVALTILNRYYNGMGENIRDVIYKKNAYSVTKWKLVEHTEYDENVLEAVLMAFKENRHPQDMYYFRTKHYHEFGKPYTVSDDLYFSTEK